MRPLAALPFVLLLAVSVPAQDGPAATHPSGVAAQQRDRDPFRQMFSIRGVEFTKEQQAKVDELRKKSIPKLREAQRKVFGIYTAKQRRARREAQQAARKANKRGRELRQAIDAAVKLTDEQKKQLAVAQKERDGLVQKIQQEVRGLLTAEQRRLAQRRRKRNSQAKRGPRVRPTHANVKYGNHERQVMDVWLARSDKPTPVLVSIHGGGFRAGNKSVSPALLRECLKSGISVAAITYRLSQHKIAPAQFYDCARAVQFIRSKSKEWNLDPKRFAATGGSAGAGLSLWLGFHDDLAKPDAKDPVARQSTRLQCMVVFNGQTSYDPRFIRKLFPGTDTYKHPALAQLYGVDLNKLDSLPEEKYKLFELTSPIAHLTKDDAPAMLLYSSEFNTPIRNQGIGIHHPRFGKVLKERMDTLKIECQVKTGIGRRGTDSTTLTMEFLKKHLGVK
jgi:acetyl esterase/lipase